MKMNLVYKYFVAAITWLFVYLYPTFQFILMVGFFVFADSITGALAAYKRNAFNSKELRRVFPKFITYGLAIIIAHIIQLQFFPDFPALKCVSGYLAFTELVSIDENIKEMYGISVFKFFIDKLQKPIKK